MRIGLDARRARRREAKVPTVGRARIDFAEKRLFARAEEWEAQAFRSRRVQTSALCDADRPDEACADSGSPASGVLHGSPENRRPEIARARVPNVAQIHATLATPPASSFREREWSSTVDPNEITGVIPWTVDGILRADTLGTRLRARLALDLSSTRGRDSPVTIDFALNARPRIRE